MLSESQEKVFDAYFAECDRFDITRTSGEDLKRPARILKIISCSMGRVRGKHAAVLRFLLDRGSADLSEIHQATGLGPEALSAILRKGEFMVTMTPKGCRYGIKVTQSAQNASESDCAYRRVAARGKKSATHG